MEEFRLIMKLLSIFLLSMILGSIITSFLSGFLKHSDIYYFPKSIQRLYFNIQFSRVKNSISEMINYLYSYPILVSMKFQKEWYWKKFLEGYSVVDAVEIKIKLIDTTIKRHLNREPSSEAIERLERIKNRQELANEIKEHFNIEI